MTQSSISQSGPESAQLNFNPIHPSMELPPEQLIRLLGTETKKDRKSQPGSGDPLAVDSASNKAPARHNGASSAPGTRRGKRPVMLILIIALTAAVAALLFAFSTTLPGRDASPATAIVTPGTGSWHPTAERQAAIDGHLMNLQKAAQQRFDQRTAEAVEKTASAGLPGTGE